MRLRRFTAAVVLALLLLSAPCLMGQSLAGGSVVGTVTDPSGAVVPGAKVALTSVQTGTTLETTTSSAGQYVFPVVPVGTYKMTVTGSGFQQEVISNIEIPLNKTLTEDVKLRLGAASSSIEVTASAVHLEQQTSQASTTVDEHTYSVLPIALNGAARSPTMIADLMPGVADSPGVSGSAGPTGQAFRRRSTADKSLAAR